MHERALRLRSAVMNPFDLPGPQFLAFYAMLGVVVVLRRVYYFKQQAEGGEPGPAARRQIHI